MKLSSQVAVTILAVVGWLVFNSLFWTFFSDDFFTWEAHAIANASHFITGGIVATIWIKWRLDNLELAT